jgi:hypothetical protein
VLASLTPRYNLERSNREAIVKVLEDAETAAMNTYCEEQQDIPPPPPPYSFPPAVISWVPSAPPFVPYGPQPGQPHLNVQHPNVQMGMARPPRMGLYKTRLCLHWAEAASCPYQEKCRFAHGASDLQAPHGGHRLRPPQYTRGTPGLATAWAGGQQGAHGGAFAPAAAGGARGGGRGGGGGSRNFAIVRPEELERLMAATVSPETKGEKKVCA